MFRDGFQGDSHYKTHQWEDEDHVFVDAMFPVGLAPRLTSELRSRGTETVLSAWEYIKRLPIRPLLLNWIRVLIGDVASLTYTP
jgi:hypothetical protein